VTVPDRDEASAEAGTPVAAGAPARAVALLQSQVAAGRAGILTRLALGRALLAADRIADALACARDLSDFAPELADAALLLGSVLIAAGHLPSGIAELQRALRLAPEHAGVQIALAAAWLEAGEADRAKELLIPLTKTQSPQRAEAERLMQRCDEARAATRSAPGYVRHLFDQFSADYERKMTDELNYRAPQILRELFAMIAGRPRRKLAILDLGCGTGLAGAAFAGMAKRIDGIDLSPRMLEIARARGIYTSLACADIESAVEEGPRYDLVLAADSLVYLGDLSAVFRGAAARLQPRGHFFFTVEKASGSGFEFGPKRRYRHSAD